MKMKQGGGLGDLTNDEYAILTEMNTIKKVKVKIVGYTFSKYLKVKVQMVQLQSMKKTVKYMQ